MSSRYVGLKIGAIVQSALNVTNPLQGITWRSYASRTLDSAGVPTNTYTDTEITARVQPVTHDLIFKHNLEMGKVYKRFFVLTDDVQTVNRSISTAGDYLLWNDLKWRVMRLPNEFLTQWQEIIAEQAGAEV